MISLAFQLHRAQTEVSDSCEQLRLIDPNPHSRSGCTCPLPVAWGSRWIARPYLTLFDVCGFILFNYRSLAPTILLLMTLIPVYCDSDAPLLSMPRYMFFLRLIINGRVDIVLEDLPLIWLGYFYQELLPHILLITTLYEDRHVIQGLELQQTRRMNALEESLSPTVAINMSS